MKRVSLPVHLFAAVASALSLIWVASFAYPETGTNPAFFLGYAFGAGVTLAYFWGATQIIVTVVARLSRLARYAESEVEAE